MQQEAINNVIGNVRRIEYQTNRFVDSIFYGAYKSVFKGRGIEFSEVREYRIGDDIRSIDWNVTARMGSLYMKEFVEERDLNLIIAFDVSGSLDFGTQEKLKKTLASELAASLCFSALRNNDRSGLVLFTDKVEKYIPPAKGRQHNLRIIREMLYHRPDGRSTDLGSSLKFMGSVLKKRGVVFLISDFDEETREYSKQLRMLRKKHDVISVRIRDNRELEIPDIGFIELEDAETGEQLLVDTSDPFFRENYCRLVCEQDDEIKRFFKSNGLDLIDISTSHGWVKPLKNFFNTRQRRMIR